MNHKQKLEYMALGAGILALGIIIGSSHPFAADWGAVGNTTLTV